MSDMHPASSTRAPSERYLLFLGGYLAILLPTLYFKQSHLVSLYKGGLPVVLKSVVDYPTWIDRALFTFAFFGRDVLEVLVIWGAVFVTCSVLLKIKPLLVMVAGVFFSLLVIGGNLISFRELGTFLTRDTLSISVEWVAMNPGIVREYVSPKNLAFLPLAAAWVAIPIFVVKKAPREGVLSIFGRYLSPGILSAAALACLGLSASAHLIRARGPLPLWGYWSSTALSLLEIDTERAAETPLLSASEIRDRYRSLVYPGGSIADSGRMVDLDRAALRPRHIVVVALETAPRKYYPILDNPDMAAFHKMQEHAIVSEDHFTTRPSTTWSTYSILSGTYPALRKEITKFGSCEGDGLAAILAGRGYEPTFIDSCRIDFHDREPHREMWANLGFKDLVDPLSFPPRGTPSSYETALGKESRSFGHALKCLLQAEERGKKAVIFISTLFGHYDWKARPGDEKLPGKEKIYKNCMEIDRIIGSFLKSLEERGLTDDVMILVTGDHGLRNEAEFASLGEPMMVGGASFNVPFLLYAPGLLQRETRLPYATSHIDIAPTLLELAGVPSDPFLFHGESMLDTRLRDRVIFLMNSGLSPCDGYYWKGRFFTFNNLTGIGEVGRIDKEDHARSGPRIAGADEAIEPIPAPLKDPKEVLEAAKAIFRSTARHFAEKRRVGEGQRSER